MAIWEIRIDKSFSGRSNRMKWSNKYYIESALTDITATILRETVDAIVAAERAAHLNSVYFIKAFMRQKADNALNAPSNAFVSRILDGVGDRAATTPALPIEVALAVTRETEQGRAGTILLRGCLMQSDVQVSADNSYRLATPATFQTGGTGSDTIIEKLNGDIPGGSFVIPDRAGLTVQTARNVVQHSIGGVVIVKSNRNRSSVESDEVKTAQRQINALWARIKRLYKRLKTDVLTGDYLALAVDLATTAFNVYMALPVGPRAMLKMPVKLLALKAG